jgi:hypothetical protein
VGPIAPMVLTFVAALYFAGVWCEGLKTGGAGKWLKFPATLQYFAQVAALFPHAARHALDYRAEGWICRDKKWVEIDVEPHFPIDTGHKENRFYRALHFYDRHRPTMRALDEFIVKQHNEAAVAAASSGTGDAEKIGGVRFAMLRHPFGKPGEKPERFTRKPLESYPDGIRENRYWTPESMREERCARIAR